MPTLPTTPADAFVEQPASRDEEAVAEALAAIARGADLHQWELVRAAFADEVELDYGTPERLTPDDIVARWRPLLEGFDATQHALADVEPRVAGDRATATSRFRATHVFHGGVGGDAWVLEGRYEHALVHTPTGWKVSRMRMIPERSLGNAALPEQARARGAVLAAALPARERDRETVRAFLRRLEETDDTGDAFAALFVVRGGRIVDYRESTDPGALQRAVGGDFREAFGARP